MLKKFSFSFTLFLISFSLLSAQSKTIYFFPGQGSDYRIFQDIEYPPEYNTVCFYYPVPKKGETLQEFAYRFIEKIDTTENYILVGVSLGGMMCSELADTLKPEKVIIISSAKCRNELPGRYKFQKTIPLNKLVPKKVIKVGALIAQPIVEPDRNNNKETFKAMLGAKKPLYLKRSINMIVNWDKRTYNEKIIHIHGTNDHTLPYRNIDVDYTIENGSHMMTLTKAEEINKILKEIF